MLALKRGLGMDTIEEDRDLMDKSNIENETSIEEVLASIRQIISEDVEDQNTHKSTARSSQKISRSDTVNPLQSNEDILDLTDVLSKDGTVIRLNPRQEKKVNMKAKPKSKHNQNWSDEDVLDLVDEDKDDHLNSLANHNQKSEALKSNSQETIFSPETAQKSVAALKELNKLNDKVCKMINDGSFGQQTMEEFVIAIMKPMLKAWMDAHLPSLVKWVVAEQIEKLLREKQDSSS
jgi:cell pole-organizing protein PopZ